MSNAYLPLVVPRLRNVLPVALAHEARQWSSVKTIASHTFHDSVTSIAFRPDVQCDLAVAHGLSISLIAPTGGHIRKTLTRFRGVTYSPDFKYDGRLMAVGCGDGVVKVMDVSSRTPLRMLTGHQGAVRSAKFNRDGLHILSGCDDSIVRVFDIATSTCLFSLKDATDCVRAQNSSPASRQVWATGCADGKARLYDLRSKECIFTLDHEAQVDDVHILPGGAQAITVGGPEVRVWDFFSGGTVIANMASHAKAVTSAAVDGDSNRIITAGLDGYVKVHDMASFKTKGIMSFPAQITSVAVSWDGRRFGVGMSDGAVEIRAVKSIAKKAADEIGTRIEVKEREFEGYGRGFVKGDFKAGPHAGSKRYFNRGPTVEAGSGDIVAGEGGRPKLTNYEMSLKKFDHAVALNHAVALGRPAILISVVDELLSRGTLDSALSGREIEELYPMLMTIGRNIQKPKYSKKLMLLLNTVLDIYGECFGSNEKVDVLLRKILRVVKSEVRACKELNVLQGGVDMMMWAPRV